MERLSYKALNENNYGGFLLKEAPEKVMQFGKGNFLRAFVDHWFDLANEHAGWNGKCCIIQSVPSALGDEINAQEGLYTLCLRGSVDGRPVEERRVISSVSRCLDPYQEEGFRSMMALAESDDLELIVSNTTEAGIVFDPACRLEDRPCVSFPGKLTQVLHRRYQAGKRGLIILACELIDDNGKELLRCVDLHADQWELGEGFKKYIHEECVFCGSLVDRIVPGPVRDPQARAALERELGYEDPLLTVGEHFGLWVIEGPDTLSDILPFRKAGLEDRIFLVPDMSPYKKRKVRILNGAHTGCVLGAYLAGFDIVRQCMGDKTVSAFMDRMLLEEIVPILPLDREDCCRFAAAVRDRFDNPFVDHALLSISLNSTAKWRTRNMPSLLEHVRERGSLPACLAMSFAAYIAFYTNDIQSLEPQGLVCRRPGGESYVCSDDRWVLEFFHAHREDTVETLVRAVMTQERMWGMDLTEVPGFEAVTVENLKLIREQGALAAFASCL